jgi:hypothetical protein
MDQEKINRDFLTSGVYFNKLLKGESSAEVHIAITFWDGEINKKEVIYTSQK